MNTTQFGRQIASYGHKKGTGMAHDINKLGTKVFFILDYRQFELVDNVKSPF